MQRSVILLSLFIWASPGVADESVAQGSSGTVRKGNSCVNRQTNGLQKRDTAKPSARVRLETRKPVMELGGNSLVISFSDIASAMWLSGQAALTGWWLKPLLKFYIPVHLEEWARWLVKKALQDGSWRFFRLMAALVIPWGQRHPDGTHMPEPTTPSRLRLGWVFWSMGQGLVTFTTDAAKMNAVSAAGGAAKKFANDMIDNHGVMLLTGAGLRAVGLELITRGRELLSSYGVLSPEVEEEVEEEVEGVGTQSTEAPQQTWYVQKYEVPAYGFLVIPLAAMVKVQPILNLFLRA